jgi:hypothetical protein
MEKPEAAAAQPAAAAPPAGPESPAPAPAVATLFSCLSDEGRDLVPIHLRIIPPPDPGDYVDARTVVSAHHRSRGYHCYPYHKPISRCLPSHASVTPET